MGMGGGLLIFTAHDTPCQGVCWFSGDYKIVQYDDGFFAYHRHQYAQRPLPLTKGIQPWGKSCFYDSLGRSVVYGTLEEAQKACEKHLEMEDANK